MLAYTGRDAAALVLQLSKICNLQVLSLCHCRWLSGAALRELPSSLQELALWNAGMGDPDEEGNTGEEEADSNTEPSEPRPSGLARSDLLALLMRCRCLQVLDLRGQRAVDDEIAVGVLGTLPRLRKVALAGTSVTLTGAAELLKCHRTTLERAGFGGLQPTWSLGEVPAFAGEALTELAIDSVRSHLVIDLGAMPKLELLNLENLGHLACGLQSAVNWRRLAATNIRQLMLSCCVLPSDFFELLAPKASQLTHLDLRFSEFLGPSRMLAHPPAGFLQACSDLKQLGVSRPSVEELQAMALLPRLVILSLDTPPQEALAALHAAVHGGRQPFPALEELVVYELPTGPPGLDCSIVSCMPQLSRLVLKQLPRGSLSTVSEMLLMLRRRNVLRSLNIQWSQRSEGDSAALARLLAEAAPQLEELAVPTEMMWAEGFMPAVVRSLPSLQVLGPSDYLQNGQLGDWLPVAGRELRLYDPRGYAEEASVKPYRSFLNMLRFDRHDPVMGVTEP